MFGVQSLCDADPSDGWDGGCGTAEAERSLARKKKEEAMKKNVLLLAAAALLFASAAMANGNEYQIENGESDPVTNCGEVRVLLTNSGDVQGYITAICHDSAALSLTSIDIGQAATDADVVAPDILADGGTLGVILDQLIGGPSPPIPPGTDQHIATYRYCCENLPLPGGPDQVTPLEFCDGALGTPPLENIIVIGGLSIGAGERLLLTDGTFTCKATPANQPPDCSGATAVPGRLWPPNHKFADVSVVGVTDPDGGPVTVTIMDIAQDEPLNGHGDGNTCPDASGVGTDFASVRPERSGAKKTPGDGRVYHISFSAEDEQGGICSGTVQVCVPHDRRRGAACVDQGPLFDSTLCD
jgi:hypothetical protein